MKITRKFTKQGQDAFATTKWTKRASRIANPDGTVVFEMADAEVPESWSQLATDIMVSKYFRKAGVPQDGGPSGIAGHSYKGPKGKDAEMGPESSAKQVIHRLAGCWRHWGETHGYFDTAEDAQAFYDELVYMLVHQVAAPNSPQWFNTGPQLRLRHDRPSAGSLLCRLRRRARSSSRMTRTPIPSRTRASSRAWTMRSSKRAASWTCGFARHASLSTAPARARTSRTSAPRTSRSRAAARARA